MRTIAPHSQRLLASTERSINDVNIRNKIGMKDGIEDIDFEDIEDGNNERKDQLTNGSEKEKDNKENNNNESKVDQSKRIMKYHGYEDYREVLDKQEQFLEYYEACGKERQAADHARIRYRDVLKWKKEDALFREKFERSYEVVTERVKDEAYERAVNGYDVPVFYRNELIGYKKLKSDVLLLAMLKARASEYRNSEGDGADKAKTVIILPSNGREIDETRMKEKGEVIREEFKYKEQQERGEEEDREQRETGEYKETNKQDHQDNEEQEEQEENNNDLSINLPERDA